MQALAHNSNSSSRKALKLVYEEAEDFDFNMREIRIMYKNVRKELQSVYKNTYYKATFAVQKFKIGP